MKVRVDDQPVEGWHKCVAGKRLTCEAETDIFIFAIPASEYQDLEEEADALDGQQVDMGIIPHLIIAGERQAKVDLKPDTYYDILTLCSTVTASRKSNLRLSSG